MVVTGSRGGVTMVARRDGFVSEAGGAGISASSCDTSLGTSFSSSLFFVFGIIGAIASHVAMPSSVSSPYRGPVSLSLRS